ncbi:hypothetical protein [Streptomyces sp. NPDC051000]|uniref:hypothetical protein n=1 Tax=Streptomyces sp. NPDC051000 TaxID=3155520 RepID=UPI0033DDD4A7
MPRRSLATRNCCWHARAVDAEAAAHALREDNDQLREHVAVYAQVIHELRTELERRTDNTTQRSPVRRLPPQHHLKR